MFSSDFGHTARDRWIRKPTSGYFALTLPLDTAPVANPLNDSCIVDAADERLKCGQLSSNRWQTAMKDAGVERSCFHSGIDLK